ncbi:uncharacterized protein LOC106703371 [Latimeria chalumnae]|uniref:uncharacterized protein LOC106703371 n=1 Tax=Latimeria chalumnae TaxID=7897 RepID=UPI0006D8D7B8|nr:PREDICTED: uncharacterized protein LOC106703371 [Latimeria chalumnae]|eukprot:XP_014343562.1 PREDICTED: uncharacterized protein LOC106703371 [Latimeria chalumnae]
MAGSAGRVCSWIFTLLSLHHSTGSTDNDCALQVIYPKSQHKVTMGRPFHLNCQVEFCSGDNQTLRVTWGMLDINSTFRALSFDPSNQRITLDKVQHEAGKANFILKIQEAEPEDQGLYRCHAKAANGATAVGHTINITVLNNTDPSEAEFTENSLLQTDWSPLNIGLIMLSLGGFILSSFFIWWFFIKGKTASRSKRKREVKEDKADIIYATLVPKDPQHARVEGEVPKSANFTEYAAVKVSRSRAAYLNIPSRGQPETSNTNIYYVV